MDPEMREMRERSPGRFLHALLALLSNHRVHGYLDIAPPSIQFMGHDGKRYKAIIRHSRSACLVDDQFGSRNVVLWRTGGEGNLVADLWEFMCAEGVICPEIVLK